MDGERQAHYVALHALKQRCEYLQKRLDAVEEENRRLKLEKVQDAQSKFNKTPATSNNTNLEKQIVLLNQQKSQMSHQIQMITNENQTLWSHLSKVMPGDSDFGDKLSLQSFHESKAKSIPMDTSSIMLDDGKESLEEISLKLINGIIMGKIELENQYSQMIDLQNENNSTDLKNFSFSSPQTDTRSALNSLKNYAQKLKDFKLALNQQKIDLTNAISNIKSFKSKSVINKNGDSCSADLDVPKVNRNSYANEMQALQDVKILNNGENNSEEKICPMCGSNFSGNFSDFYVHVSSHFDDEGEEYVDASSTFEVVP